LKTTPCDSRSAIRLNLPPKRSGGSEIMVLF
jgi:hypothetical protein